MSAASNMKENENEKERETCVSVNMSRRGCCSRGERERDRVVTERLPVLPDGPNEIQTGLRCLDSKSPHIKKKKDATPTVLKQNFITCCFLFKGTLVLFLL